MIDDVVLQRTIFERKTAPSLEYSVKKLQQYNRKVGYFEKDQSYNRQNGDKFKGG